MEKCFASPAGWQAVLVTAVLVGILLTVNCGVTAGEAEAGAAKKPPPKPVPAVHHEIIRLDKQAYLKLSYGKKLLLAGSGTSLFGPSGCEVKVTAEAFPGGALIHYSISNPTAEPQVMPRLQLGDIQLPFADTEIIDNWKVIKFSRFSNPKRVGLHPKRTYPGSCYSPVLGLRTKDLFIGTAVIYDVLGLRFEVYPTYKFNLKTKTWSMSFTPQGPLPRVGPYKKRVRSGATILPGKTVNMTLSVGVTKADKWLTAFLPYKEHFQQVFGQVRYEFTREPIAAYSMSGGHIWDRDKDGKRKASKRFKENARGYNPKTRLDLHGWKGIPELFQQVAWKRGYRRILIWQVAGWYRDHPNANMVWEITSGWTPKMQETLSEFAKIIKPEQTVGFWWGRAFTISEGFNTGQRHAWDQENPQDNQAAFWELDRAYALGVRLIGMDDISSAVTGTAWHPSSAISFLKIFPKLYQRYPEMKWIVEVAACDYLHLWGGSFVWDRQINSRFEFADYIAPGHVTHAVMKRGYMRRAADSKKKQVASSEYPKRLKQLLKWGYTPIIFCVYGGEEIVFDDEIRALVRGGGK